MDIFKFRNPNSTFLMEQGEIINGLTKKMWIERFLEAGEFAFSAPVNSDIRRKLTIGSFISHVNSTDIMIVENHEISEDKDTEAEIIVSGRSFESYFEQRIVGSNKTFPNSSGVEDYTVSDDYISVQARDLIRRHTYTIYLIDNNNAITNMEVIETVPPTGVTVERSLKQKNLYSSVIELLNEGQLGLKVVRPGPWSPAVNNANIAVVIHKGVDRRSSVTFSHDVGEIESADYLWTNKKHKNCALIQGRWVETTVMIGSPLGYNRRWMIVDASDIDQKYTAPPTGSTLSAIITKMQRRGTTELAKQKNIELAKAEITHASELAIKAQYRTDYDLGDLVGVEGNYNEKAVQRVTEFVELEDETGRNAYPTLSDPE